MFVLPAAALPFAVLLWAALAMPFCLQAQHTTNVSAVITAGSGLSRSPAIHPVRIVVGFMGGRVHADNRMHREFLIAQHLEAQNTANLHVLMFANHDRHALQAVLSLLDQNSDQSLSEAERAAADIAIFGHSWGASETVTLARSLQARGIPVAMTIQVDSVQKRGENDHMIPANVAEAVNLYQRQGLLRGRALITPEDPARTRILLNQQFHYGDGHAVDITRFPWFARTFMREHIMIENDPDLWAEVEHLLEQATRPPAQGAGS